jgi:hypothetical protein
MSRVMYFVSVATWPALLALPQGAVAIEAIGGLALGSTGG